MVDEFGEMLYFLKLSWEYALYKVNKKWTTSMTES